MKTVKFVVEFRVDDEVEPARLEDAIAGGLDLTFESFEQWDEDEVLWWGIDEVKE